MNPEIFDPDQWFIELFEFETCHECGWDAGKHVMRADSLGLPHAWCLDPIPDDMPYTQAEAELACRFSSGGKGVAMIDVDGVSIDKDDLIQAAHEALERPSDFGYWGDLDLFRSWGLTITQCRDSDSVTRSNYRCILRDLREFVESRGCDPEDYLEDVHFSHWAYGWMEHIALRVLIEEDGDVVPENITGAFRWIASTALYLREQYHVYDDSDHSDLEYEEGLEIV